jgi:hypothetical protein
MEKGYQFDEDVQKKTLRIMELAYKINTLTDFCTFFSFSGHTHQIDFHIVKSKEKFDQDVTNRKVIYLYYDNSVEALDAAIEKLEGFLKEHQTRKESPILLEL